MTDTFKDVIDKVGKGFGNTHVKHAIILFLVLYAGVLAPNLNLSIAKWFDSPLFKLLLFFLITYVSKKHTAIGLIAAIGVLVSMQTLQQYKTSMGLVGAAMMGCKCKGLEPKEETKIEEPKQEQPEQQPKLESPSAKSGKKEPTGLITGVVSGVGSIAGGIGSGLGTMFGGVVDGVDSVLDGASNTLEKIW